MHSLGVALSLWWKIPLCLSFIKCSVRWLSHVWLLCEPMDWSTSGFPVVHHLPELAQTHVHESAMPSNHLILCCPLLLLSVPASGSFPVSRLFASSGQSIGASERVLLINIQGWFPLGLTGLIPLLFKGLSRIFSGTTVWKSQLSGAQASLRTNSHVLERP